MIGWLDEHPVDEWIEVIDPEGDTLGWLPRNEATRQRLPLHLIEVPERYLDDPWVIYHVQLCEERELFKRTDLNDVQQILLSSALIRRRRHAAQEAERTFEERFFASNPEGYKAFKDQQEAQEEANEGIADVEQRVPANIEEFLATIAEFSEAEDEGRDKDREAESQGWLASTLSPDELGEMSSEDN